METVSEQTSFKGSFERWRRSRLEEQISQIDGPVYESDLLPNIFVFTRVVTKVWVLDEEHNSVGLKDIRQMLRGYEDND